jgi:septal ring factor EnvC (AmiA/AmiB activator)
MTRLLTILLIALAAAVPLAAQAPDKKDEQELAALAKEIATQQAEIADNQSKIDSKLVELQETIRVARLFAGKAGK